MRQEIRAEKASSGTYTNRFVHMRPNFMFLGKNMHEFVNLTVGARAQSQIGGDGVADTFADDYEHRMMSLPRQRFRNACCGQLPRMRASPLIMWIISHLMKW